jgi:hypothetical protein
VRVSQPATKVEVASTFCGAESGQRVAADFQGYNIRNNLDPRQFIASMNTGKIEAEVRVFEECQLPH